MNDTILEQYRDILSQIKFDTPTVLTGGFALLALGATSMLNTTPDVLTDDILLRGVHLYRRVNYCYVPAVDCTNYIKGESVVKGILVPTIERTFVECIKNNLEFIDEGFFCDSLERYMHSSDFNYELLCEVAEFYGVPKSEIDYWLDEASDYNSY